MRAVLQRVSRASVRVGGEVVGADMAVELVNEGPVTLILEV
jgi:D-Tyr-tRNAtyr deacylase